MQCAQHLKTFPAKFLNQTKVSSPMFHWSYTLKGFTLEKYPLCHAPSAKKSFVQKNLSRLQYHPHWLGTIKEGKTKKAKNGAELGSQKVCERKTRQKCTSKTDTI